jgi:hypothetical protein
MEMSGYPGSYTPGTQGIGGWVGPPEPIWMLWIIIIIIINLTLPGIKPRLSTPSLYQLSYPDPDSTDIKTFWNFNFLLQIDNTVLCPESRTQSSCRCWRNNALTCNFNFPATSNIMWSKNILHFLNGSCEMSWMSGVNEFRGGVYSLSSSEWHAPNLVILKNTINLHGSVNIMVYQALCMKVMSVSFPTRPRTRRGKFIYKCELSAFGFENISPECNVRILHPRVRSSDADGSFLIWISHHLTSCLELR